MPFRRILPFFCVTFFVSIWLTLHYDLYLDPDHFLPRDNKDSFFLFYYVSLYLKYLHSIPDWFYSGEGGVWLAPITNNLHLLLPHHIVGYAIVALTDLHPNGVYKFCFLILGQGLFLLGIYWIARRILDSAFLASFLILTFLVTGGGISFLHQEQALSTLFYIPFIWECLFRSRQNSRYLVVAAALLGLSLNNHYPQLVGIYWVMNGLFLIRMKKVPAAWMGMGIALLISCSPLFYSYFKYHDKLSSPARMQAGTIEANSYEDYFQAALQTAGVYPAYLRFYVTLEDKDQPWIDSLDRKALYASPFVGLLLLLSCFLKIPKRNYHLGIMAVLLLLSIGIYGPLPRLLWYVVPGIRIFRQWYFFISFFNLHLLLFLFLTLKQLPIRYAKGLAILIFLTSLPWAVRTLNTYRTRMFATNKEVHRSMPLPFNQMNNERYLRVLLFGKNPTWKYRHPYIIPLGTNLSSIRKLTQHSGLWWARESRLDKITPSQVTLNEENGNIKLSLLEVPSLANAVLLMQYNDGQWKFKTTPEPLHLLLIPISEFGKERTLILERTSSPWKFLILIMWLPLFIAAIRLLPIRGFGLKYNRLLIPDGNSTT